MFFVRLHHCHWEISIFILCSSYSFISLARFKSLSFPLFIISSSTMCSVSGFFFVVVAVFFLPLPVIYVFLPWNGFLCLFALMNLCFSKPWHPVFACLSNAGVVVCPVSFLSYGSKKSLIVNLFHFLLVRSEGWLSRHLRAELDTSSPFILFLFSQNVF